MKYRRYDLYIGSTKDDNQDGFLTKDEIEQVLDIGGMIAIVEPTNDYVEIDDGDNK